MVSYRCFLQPVYCPPHFWSSLYNDSFKQMMVKHGRTTVFDGIIPFVDGQTAIYPPVI